MAHEAATVEFLAALVLRADRLYRLYEPSATNVQRTIWRFLGLGIFVEEAAKWPYVTSREDMGLAAAVLAQHHREPGRDVCELVSAMLRDRHRFMQARRRRAARANRSRLLL